MSSETSRLLRVQQELAAYLIGYFLLNYMAFVWYLFWKEKEIGMWIIIFDLFSNKLTPIETINLLNYRKSRKK